MGEKKKQATSDTLEAKQIEEREQSKKLGRVVHSEPLGNRPMSEAFGKLPEMDLVTK